DHFGGLQKAQTAYATPAASFRPGYSAVRNNNAEGDNDQSDIIFGFEAPAASSPERFRYVLLANLISGGMSTPLFQEVREKRGLVYSISAVYTPFEETGLFTIGTGTSDPRQVVDVSLDVLGAVVRNGFSEAEMAQARERAVRSSQTMRESSASSCEIN